MLKAIEIDAACVCVFYNVCKALCTYMTIVYLVTLGVSECLSDLMCVLVCVMCSRAFTHSDVCVVIKLNFIIVLYCIIVYCIKF